MPTPYPLDLTAQLASNFITGEVKTISVAKDRIFVLSGGPFYTQDMVLRNSANGAILRPLVDYKALHLVKDATLMSKKPVCAVIQILNTAVTSVTADYRVIGGNYSDTVETIRTLLEGLEFVAPAAVWGQILFQPAQFPPAYHLHHAGDIYGLGSVVAQLEAIRVAILQGDSAAFGAVYQYIQQYVAETLENNGEVVIDAHVEGTGYRHVIGHIVGLQSVLDISALAHTNLNARYLDHKDGIADKHDIADINGLSQSLSTTEQALLNLTAWDTDHQAGTTGRHAIGHINGLQTALDVTALAHTDLNARYLNHKDGVADKHEIADIIGLPETLAALDGGNQDGAAATQQALLNLTAWDTDHQNGTTGRHSISHINGLQQQLNDIIDFINSLAIYIPDQNSIISPNGTTLAVNPEWLSNRTTPNDILPVSRVGRLDQPFLPIDTNLFSIRYPRTQKQPLGTAMIEPNGTLNVLVPSTNGEDIRLTYAKIDGFVNGQTTVTPSNLPYEPTELEGTNLYVHGTFPANKELMVVELHDKTTTDFVEHALVLTSGTLSADEHTLVRLGNQLVDEIDLVTTPTTNPRSNLVQLACPVGIIINPTTALLFMGVPGDVKLLVLTIDLLTGDVGKRVGANFLTMARTAAPASPHFIAWFNGVMGTNSSFSLFNQQNGETYTGHTSLHRTLYSLGIERNPTDPSLVRIRQTQLYRITSGALTNNSDYGFSFVLDLENFHCTIDDDYWPLPSVSFTASGNVLSPTTEIYRQVNSLGTVSYRQSYTVLSNGAEIYFRSNNPLTSGGIILITMSTLTPPPTVSAFEAMNPFNYLGKTGAASSQTFSRNYWIPLQTPVALGTPAFLFNQDVIYGLGGTTGWVNKTNYSTTNTEQVTIYDFGVTPATPNGTAVIDAVPLTNTRYGSVLDTNFGVVTTRDSNDPVQNGNNVGQGVFYGGFDLDTEIQTRYLQLGWFELLNPTAFFTVNRPLTLTVANAQRLTTELNLFWHMVTGLNGPSYSANRKVRWSAYYVPASGTRPAYLFATVIGIADWEVVRPVHIVVGYIVNPTTVVTGNGPYGEERSFDFSSLGFEDIIHASTPSFPGYFTESQGVSISEISNTSNRRRLASCARQTSLSQSDRMVMRLPYEVTLSTGPITGGLVSLLFVNDAWVIQQDTQVDRGVAQGHLATLFPSKGVGYISAGYGYGTQYVFVWWTNNEIPTEPQYFLRLTSARPSSAFTLNVSMDIPTYIGGRFYTIPQGLFDLSSIEPIPANKTFFAYAVLEGGVAKFKVTTSPLGEAWYRVFLGKVVTDANGITSSPFRAVSRIDTYRPSVSPKGSSFPVNAGSPETIGTGIGGGGTMVPFYQRGTLAGGAGTSSIEIALPFPLKAVHGTLSSFINAPGNVYGPDASYSAAITTIDENLNVVVHYLTIIAEYNTGSNNHSFSVVLPDNLTDISDFANLVITVDVGSGYQVIKFDVVGYYIAA